MIVGSLSTRAVNRQDIAGSASAVADGQAVPAAARTESAAGTDAASASSGSVSYVSPFGRYDYSSHLEILQFRNAETGKVTLQIPSERVVDAYRRVAAYSGNPAATHATAAAQLGRPVSPAVSANQDGAPPAATSTATAIGAQGAAAGVASGNANSTGQAAPADSSAAPTAPTQAAPAAAAPEPAVVINVGTPAAAPSPAPVAVPAPAVEAKPAATSGTGAIA